MLAFSFSIGEAKSIRRSCGVTRANTKESRDRLEKAVLRLRTTQVGSSENGPPQLLSKALSSTLHDLLKLRIIFTKRRNYTQDIMIGFSLCLSLPTIDHRKGRAP